MSKPLISVVILNYNGLKYLKKTIPSVLNLSYSNCEIIVADNGSTDGSVEYLKKNSKIKLIENGANLGYSKGKKSGLNDSKGEYVLLLDEDILLKDKFILEDLLVEYNSLEKICFLSILLEQYNQNMTTMYGGFVKYFGFYNNEKINLKRLIGKESFECASPDGGAIFFRKKYFVELGMYDESQPYYIDVGDMGIRASVMGFKNYTYCKKSFVNLGDDRKGGDIERWCWKYKYNFSGLARVMWKNYTLCSLLFYFPSLIVFCVIKTAKQVIVKKSFCVIRSFAFSIILFCKNFQDTLKERKKIQGARSEPKDIFLKITPPNFNE